MLSLVRRWKRHKLLARPFPESWEAHLAEHLPFVERLEGALAARFRDELKLFVWERHFFGAGGLKITDEHRVVIGAVAVRLILGLDRSYYDPLKEIVVYPHDFKRPTDDPGPGGEHLLGEFHDFGTVVLSWPAVLRGLRDPHDGRDTATHEFAHVLDKTSLGFDGTPRLRANEDYRVWGEVMTLHFLALQDGDPEIRQVLRDYGALNEAEFFAVATEAFFERPKAFQNHAPELYAVLSRFYGFDVPP